jgi:hypothetical protein
VIDVTAPSYPQGHEFRASASLISAGVSSIGKAENLPIEWLGAIRHSVLDSIEQVEDALGKPEFSDTLGRLRYVTANGAWTVGWLLLDDRLELGGENDEEVDAMDLSWSKEHIDTFVIVSGDSDFSPLVSKLKENGRHVIGLGMKASTSPLLANGCDEFIYYEDLARGETAPAGDQEAPRDRDDAFGLLVETVRALERENFDVIQASLVKDTIKRKRPAFSEAALGYGSFSELLEDAKEAGKIVLQPDERSGTFTVRSAETRSRRGRGRRKSRPSGPRMPGSPPPGNPTTRGTRFGLKKRA